jgi:hypothetical protein
MNKDDNMPIPKAYLSKCTFADTAQKDKVEEIDISIEIYRLG